jgi:hypothetical protein
MVFSHFGVSLTTCLFSRHLHLPVGEDERLRCCDMQQFGFRIRPARSQCVEWVLLTEDSEIISAIRYMFDNNKSGLISFLKQLGISVPTKSTYNQILSIIRHDDSDGKFARAVFHVNDLESGVQVADIIQALSTLALDELRSLANELSGDEKKWKFKKTPKATIIYTITTNCGPNEIEKAVKKLVDSQEIDLFQTGKWVIGPLGITKSVEERKTLEVLDFIETHFDNQVSLEFLKKSGKFKKYPQSLLASHQLILTHFTLAEIMATTNQLLAEGTLKLRSFEDYYGFYSSPVGVFLDQSDDPLKRLAEILYNQFEPDEVKRDFELESGDHKQRLMEKLLLRAPDKVFADYFGIAQLKSIAKSLGLVAVDTINDKKKLIEYVMLRIGFSVPTTPRGIHQQLASMIESTRNLQKSSIQEQRGIVASAFVELEGIIKDLICFYSTAYWEEKINNISTEEEMHQLEALEKFLKDSFPGHKIERPLHRLTFGQLKTVFQTIDSEASKDEMLRHKTLAMLGRDTILAREQNELLDTASRLRAKFAHDTETPLETADCVNCISVIRQLVESLVLNHTYPTLVSIRKKIMNEYGIEFFEGVDEFNETWTIRTSGWLETGVYLMKGEKPVSIDPVIVEKFWTRPQIG